MGAPTGGDPDADAYHGIFDPFYRGAFDTGRQVRIVHIRQLHDPRGQCAGIAPEEAARHHPVLVVPGLYIVDEAAIDWLAGYAHAGGHLVLGPRNAYADHEGRARRNLACDIPLSAASGNPNTRHWEPSMRL